MNHVETLLLAPLFGLLCLPTSAHALVVVQSGYLLGGSDAPANGPLAMRFRLYSVDTLGSPEWSAPANQTNTCPIPVTAGYYTVHLGDDCGPPFSAEDLPADAVRYLEVEVAGVKLSPRARLVAVPAAARALTSADTDALRATLAADGTFNDPGNPVDWSQLKNVPDGLEDGLALAPGGGLALSGTDLSLGTTAVAPGTYSGATVTVDAYGRVTAASPSSTEIFLRGPTALDATGATLTSLEPDATGLVFASGSPAGNDLEAANGQTVTIAGGGPQPYRNITVHAGGTLNIAAWSGTSGGKLEIRASGTVTVESGGLVTVKGRGYRGGISIDPRGSSGQAGESYLGVGARTFWTRNGGGGGGGQSDSGNFGQAGAGGGYGTAGADGLLISRPCCVSEGGLPYGYSDLTTLHLGSGGGSGGTDQDFAGRGGDGGNGGGAIYIEAGAIIVNGTIDARGDNGGDYYVQVNNEGGGAGSGGSIHRWAGSIDLRAGSTVTAVGGIGGAGADGGPGGDGGDGRILLRGPSILQNGTINGAARKVDTAAAAPVGATTTSTSGTYVSPAIALAAGSRLVQVDLYADRAPRTFLSADVCVADTDAASSESACFLPVAPSGSVDVSGNKAFARVRVSVADDGPPGTFRLRGLRLVTRP